MGGFKGFGWVLCRFGIAVYEEEVARTAFK